MALLLHWKLDEVDGTTAADASGNGRDGTHTNSPTIVTTGRIRNAVSMNDTTAHILLAGLAIPTTGSIAFFYRPERAFNSGHWEALMGVGDATNGRIQIEKFSDNNLYCGWFRTGNDDRCTIAASATNWINGSMQHYALTWASGGASKLYHNGVEIKDNGTTTLSTSTGTSWRFGTDSGGSNGASGDLDDIRVYDEALSATFIKGIAFPFPHQRRHQNTPFVYGRVA